jgi:phosphoribosylformylglycinamidine synthase subunit PurL
MAMASGIGARLAAPAGLPAHAFWFGEDQARYVLTVREGDAQKVISGAAAAGVTICRLGLSCDDALAISGERPILLKTLIERHESWFPGYMSGAKA